MAPSAWQRIPTRPSSIATSTPTAASFQKRRSNAQVRRLLVFCHPYYRADHHVPDDTQWASKFLSAIYDMVRRLLVAGTASTLSLTPIAGLVSSITSHLTSAAVRARAREHSVEHRRQTPTDNIFCTSVRRKLQISLKGERGADRGEKSSGSSLYSFASAFSLCPDEPANHPYALPVFCMSLEMRETSVSAHSRFRLASISLPTSPVFRSISRVALRRRTMPLCTL